MTFGINAQRLTGQRLGVGRYIEYLLKNWSRMLLPSDRISIYLRDPAHVARLRGKELEDLVGAPAAH